MTFTVGGWYLVRSITIGFQRSQGTASLWQPALFADACCTHDTDRHELVLISATHPLIAGGKEDAMRTRCLLKQWLQERQGLFPLHSTLLAVSVSYCIKGLQDSFVNGFILSTLWV